MWRSACLVLLAGAASAEPRFVPVTMPEHVYGGGWEHFVGGGLAVFDCNEDGLPELYAAGGANPATLFANVSTAKAVHFEAVTPDLLALTSVTGAYPVDLDGNTFSDLIVLRAGPNKAFLGGPDCTFAETDLIPDLGDRWTTAFSATWEQGQTRPTLAFGNYVDRSDPEGPFEACDVNHLMRPEGDGYVVTELAPGYCPLSILFSDWGAGVLDLRVSNDRHYYVSEGEEQMWRLDDVPRLLTEADGWQRHRLWGMGIAARDMTGDGLQEVYLTSMGDQRMQRRVDPDLPTYADVPFDLGTTTHRPAFGGDGRPSTGWHVAFGDVTNDGRDDIFVAKGNVDQMPGLAMEDPNALLVQTAPMRWDDVTEGAGLASFHRGRGAALEDFNGDGLLDVAVVNRRAPLEVWQNVSRADGAWLKVALRDGGSGNVFGIGAWIEVKVAGAVIRREVTLGGGHAGGTLGPAHFGLGDVQEAELRVVWPDGETSDWQTVSVQQTVTLDR
ncbi:CRTAC1 family protein [Pseudaestuariivita sp.]|uniref:CRTAC1 family protein n=1 Tax=Pseudaestuariivita sp. TaxID=2211669 RepID=UPI00405A085A